MGFGTLKPYFPSIHFRLYRSFTGNCHVLTFKSIKQRRIIVTFQTFPRGHYCRKIGRWIIRKTQDGIFFQIKIYIALKIDWPGQPCTCGYDYSSATCSVTRIYGGSYGFCIIYFTAGFGSVISDRKVFVRIDKYFNRLHRERCFHLYRFIVVTCQNRRNTQQTKAYTQHTFQEVSLHRIIIFNLDMYISTLIYSKIRIRCYSIFILKRPIRPP